ncbi:type II toxin-antitoxin system VapC family toxin, partial [Psittacicella gerlachiana]
MSKKYLLDANIIIKAISDNNSIEYKIIEEYLTASDVELYITPLIRYEVLRGIEYQNKTEFKRHIRFLELFDSISINNKISNLATDLFRKEKFQKQVKNRQHKKLDKHNFDLMHFATAKANN